MSEGVTYTSYTCKKCGFEGVHWQKDGIETEELCRVCEKEPQLRENLYEIDVVLMGIDYRKKDRKLEREEKVKEKNEDKSKGKGKAKRNR